MEVILNSLRNVEVVVAVVVLFVLFPDFAVVLFSVLPIFSFCSNVRE